MMVINKYIMTRLIKYLIISGLLIFLIIFFVFNYSKSKDIPQPKNVYLEDSSYSDRTLNIKDIVIFVDVAEDNATRAQGLSGRKSLKDDQGMLFVFETLGIYKFWMKEMNFPIDIIWFDGNQKIVHIEKNVLPESYPKLFGPDEETKYVLEVAAGFSTKNDLKVGDTFKIN